MTYFKGDKLTGDTDLFTPHPLSKQEIVRALTDARGDIQYFLDLPARQPDLAGIAEDGLAETEFNIATYEALLKNLGHS